MHRFPLEQFEFITTRWGVYCLSPDPCNTLMWWSHYSQNHRGICLEFGARNTILNGAQEVRYQRAYPSFLPHDQYTHDDMLLVKSDVWSYENELRLICPRFTDVKFHPLLMDGNYLPFNPTDLKSAILGCQAANETIEQAQAGSAKCARYSGGTAKRAVNKYRLRIEG